MRKIEDGYIRGLVSWVIRSRVDDINVPQGHPRPNVKQTDATATIGTDFGIVCLVNTAIMRCWNRREP